MESYIISLFYIALLLLLGVLITGITGKLKFSNILFLVFAGTGLKYMGLDFFDETFILVVSSLALIMIVIEMVMELDITHIMKNFIHVLKYNIVYLFINSYILTLFVFLMFDIPGENFEVFVLCFLLSIILYTVDSTISQEFLHEKKRKIREFLKIEGVISGPVAVIFAFFTIRFLKNGFAETITKNIFDPIITAGAQLLFVALIGILMAYLFYKFLELFKLSKELSALLIITVSILIFVVSELLGANGSLAVAIYGVFLRGLMKKSMDKKYAAVFAHTLYFMVFILFGAQFFLPEPMVWLKGLGVFAVYLFVRFASILVFLKDLSLKEKLYMTLNNAKGVEAALVLLVLNFHFKDVSGINIILTLGFMFFAYSYIISTLTNRFENWFFENKIVEKKRE